MRLGVEVTPAEWPGAEGVVLDRRPAGSEQWQEVGRYAMRPRTIEVEAEPGDAIRMAGFKAGPTVGEDEGFGLLLLGDFVEHAVG